MSASGVLDRLRSLREAWRVLLWPLPALGVFLGVVLGVVLPLVDAAVDDDLSPSLKVYLFGGGADAARTVLSAVSGSLITVTALTFSLTVVTLQLASSQYSPRLLRTFQSDRVVHATLAMFLGTFTYALTVLRTVRTAADEQVAFVPQLSVTVGFLMALASVLVLVAFLSHLTGQIRAESILDNVFTEARASLMDLTSEHDPDDPRPAAPVAPALVSILFADASGFLVSIDLDEILAAATEADAVLVIERHTGASVVAGSPIGIAWSRDAAVLDGESLEKLRSRSSKAIHTGFERTAAQDLGFGLRQLTDVACKALSPGINDPTTAIHALGHSSALLCEMAARELGPVVLRDEDGEARVVLARPTLRELLDEAIAQPRRYGASDPAVLARLFALLDELAWSVRPEHQELVADQLTRMRITASAEGFDPTERSQLSALAQRVDQTLARRLSSPSTPSVESAEG